MKKPKVGDDIYIPSAMYISRGSDDRVGGLAKVKTVKDDGKNDTNSVFITVEEIPGTSFNWKMLSEQQDELKKQFGDKRSYPDPDEDRPWAEEGDIVDGKTYKGPPIW